MSKTITLQMFSDPGHGWVRFPKARLERMDIADKISPYSYQRGTNAFLEEDCDLTVLCNALRERGYEIKIKCAHTDRQSKIRGYDHYRKPVQING